MFVTLDNLPQVLEKLGEKREFGLDTETTGLSQSDRLFSLILATDDESFYFNFQNYGSFQYPHLPRQVLTEDLRPILESIHATWYIQNAKFDMRMLSKEGIELKGHVHDTYAIERVLCNNHFGGDAYTLAGMAKRRGWAKDDKVKEWADKHKECFTNKRVPGKKKIVKFYHFEKVPPEVMVPYGEHDARLHFDIAKDQIRELESIDRAGADRYPSQMGILQNERYLTKPLFRMERRGIKVDVDYTRNAMAHEQGLVARAHREFETLTGRPYVDSKALFVDVFTQAGEKFPLTDKGNPSFTADVLEEMTTPIAAALNSIRHHEKKVSTYYSSFLHLVTPEGLIHADARQAGTESGRMSYRDPNLQNVPKEDEAPDIDNPYLVRACFVPRPGFTFHSIDYRQLEYCLMMDYAGEHKIIERLNAGDDYHQAIADQVGIPRKSAKILNFMLGYGGGADKVALTLGISRLAAKELVMDYWAGVPRLARMMSAVRDAGKARGFIFNAFGRRNYLANNEWAYILPNHLIQGTGADLVKTAMVRVDGLLQEKKAETGMLIQVHDELLIETKIGEEDLIPRIREIMASSYVPRNGIQLSTSVEHSTKSWGAKDKVKGIYGQGD